MATPRSLVALRCAFDQALIGSSRRERDESLAATAELFFPGTTGENIGWSESLRPLLNEDADAPVPSIEEALTDILENPDLSTVELARLVYLVGALSHLPHLTPRATEPEGLFAQALSLAGPGGRETEVAMGYDLLQFLAANLSSRQAWREVAYEATVARLLSIEVASVPMCDAYPIMIDDVVCMKVVTDFEKPDIYFNNLKDVVDPLNWHRNQPQMFCEMRKQNPFARPADNWNRVLEFVSLVCPQGLPRIKTALKYYNQDLSATEAQVVFDMDDYKGPEAGDGQVAVDFGYIYMRATGSPGVFVHTEKVARVNGYDPVAVSALLCEGGYGAMAMTMLFGPAKNPPADTVRWQPSATTTSTSPGTQYNTSGTGGGTGTATGTGTGSQKGFASVTVDMWLECIQKAINETSQLSTKWTKSELTLQDLVDTSQMAGARLAGAPWRYLKALSEVPMPTGALDDTAKDGAK